MTKKYLPDAVSHEKKTSSSVRNTSRISLATLASRSAAKATSHVTERASTYSLQALQDNELRSVYALFAWVANEQRAATETVQSITEARFGIDDVSQLKKRDYDEVIRFLVDLRIDELKN